MLRTLFVFPCLLTGAVVAQTPTVAPPVAVPVTAATQLRSGHVTMCEIGKGCSEETVAGRTYLVMREDGFVVKVSTGTDAHRGFADVSITNGTTAPAQLNPANFRMEESVPRLHRLYYVDPNRPKAEMVAERAPVEAPVKLGKGLPPPEYWTSDEHAEEKKVKAVKHPPAVVKTLHAGVLAPAATTSGRVFFEKPRKSAGVSLFVAMPGALFEFPCNFIVEPKPAKHHKGDPPAEEAAGTS